MSQAFILCPNSGQYVYVGLNLEWPELESLPVVGQELDCPACEDTHEWSKDDLVLRSDGMGE